MEEMEWFIKAADPSRAWRSARSPKLSACTSMKSKTLAKAFEEITGIKVKHDIIQEG